MDLPYGLSVDMWSAGVVARDLVTAEETNKLACEYAGMALCVALAGPITEKTWPDCAMAAAWKSMTYISAYVKQRPWPIHMAPCTLPELRVGVG